MAQENVRHGCRLDVCCAQSGGEESRSLRAGPVRNPRPLHCGESSMVARVAAIAIACVWLALCGSSSALQCDVTGTEAPTEVTLMASPKAPETQAIILYSNCTYKELSVDTEGKFSNANLFFDRLDSVPSSTKSILVKFYNTKPGAASGMDLSGATSATTLVFSDVYGLTFGNIKFPPSLTTFNVMYSELDPSFSNAILPPTLTEINFQVSKLSVLPRLPPNLTSLYFFRCNISSIDFEYPSSLEELNFAGNSGIVNIGPATLPPALTLFEVTGGYATKSIRGIALPHTLKTFLIGVWPDNEVELRQSDVAFLLDTFDNTTFFNYRIGAGAVSYPNCSDETANLATLWSVTVCSISDARFESLYSKTLAPPLSSPSEDSSGSTTTAPESGHEPNPTNIETEERDDGGDDTRSDPERRPSQQTVDGSRSNKSEKTTRSPASGGGSSAGANQTTLVSTVSPTVIAVAVLLSITIATALAVIGNRVFATRRHRDDKAYVGIESPSNTQAESGASVSHQSTGEAYVDSDIRNDPSMLLFHIEFKEVTMGAVIARSRLYETLYGEYNSKPVVLKRVAAEALELEGDDLSGQFMDDIRLRSTINHPKIVAFIGATWSQQHGVMAVSEYMEGGDLATLLAKQPVPSSPQDWFQPWTATKAVKSKALIARDVVEVMVSLHSYKTPILHRNLKASNVLLDSRGNAKLSDFGIERELSAGAIMMSQAEGIAWIAPEVLRGEQYSEKADVYALGVLLVELDQCRSPYEDNRANAHIAAAVVSGQLRPSASDSSPPSVKELIAKCVSYDESDRPTAMEVNFALRKLRSSDADNSRICDSKSE